MTVINKIALLLVIIGALNWGLVGLFSFDAVAWVFGGAYTLLARIVYIAVALAGVFSISFLFHRESDRIETHA